MSQLEQSISDMAAEVANISSHIAELELATTLTAGLVKLSDNNMLPDDSVVTAGALKQQGFLKGDSLPASLAHNKIINGGFDVWQRGNGFSSSGYTADRWLLTFGAGAAGTVAKHVFPYGQEDVAGNPRYFLRFTKTNAGTSNSGIEQRVEGVNSFAGQQVTLSFYARSGTGLDIESSITQRFGSGGSSEVVAATKDHTLDGNWQRFTHNITLPSISGKTIGNANYVRVLFRYKHDQPNSHIDIANVQLELGDIASEFAERFSTIELALCQRYYSIITHAVGFVNSQDSFIIPVMWSQPMRAAPTISITGNLNAQGGTFNKTQSSPTIDASFSHPHGAYLRFGSFNFTNIELNHAGICPTVANNTHYITADAEL